MIIRDYDFRKRCLACEKNKPNSEEHVWPIWLLNKTNTFNTKISWISGKKEFGRDCVFPICKDCNETFNKQLEIPFQKIFPKISKGIKINDYEAEITIRWMWKVTQLFWAIKYKKGEVYWAMNVRTRCTNPIAVDGARQRISLALALTKPEGIKLENNAEPLGLDVFPEYSSILSAGVLSNVSIITFYSWYKSLIPKEYSIYTLRKKMTNNRKEGSIKAKIGFSNSREAIDKTIDVANRLLLPHELDSISTMPIKDH